MLGTNTASPAENLPIEAASSHERLDDAIMEKMVATCRSVANGLSQNGYMSKDGLNMFDRCSIDFR